uniref:Glycosyltransferase 61 catalytic domain-containing protein n=1 Tax=Mucochytrium quahogii TaxID=96639 RepID=A0A7S2RD73_9STRA|mmetsp:Transcript_11974/g.22072  ORF Transcript_11974/g.22072 Transcript_11974/m.22072 type:complete len:555 (+) Transcript_11974:76-1740(+)|eukprot:CAMPEP_0203756382 /NCGR_PEP_ID=MMETSP0098-20131031/9684_1 /ASSEMBLY_ACC=CAM_ASM_000208 /TAXON_ID=96639 /ORGANISM=" , Strain NY0313808BC1" /LENGTH=554 /DNA_ID=CAMNT_0050648249 /DNA_START=887 /DNA_END=2551 /DNA_ORIENTATION=+
MIVSTGPSSFLINAKRLLFIVCIYTIIYTAVHLPLLFGTDDRAKLSQSYAYNQPSFGREFKNGVLRQATRAEKKGIFNLPGELSFVDMPQIETDVEFPQDLFRDSWRVGVSRKDIPEESNGRLGMKLVLVTENSLDGRPMSECEPMAKISSLTSLNGTHSELCSSNGISKMKCSVTKSEGNNRFRFCTYENVFIDFSRTTSNRKLKPGFWNMDCTLLPNKDPFVANNIYTEEHANFTTGFQFFPAGTFNSEGFLYTITDPVFIISHDQQNVFHSMARTVALYHTIMMTGIDPSKSILMIYDLTKHCANGRDFRGRKVPNPDCEGPSYQIYRYWFKAIVRASDIENKYGSKVKLSKLVPMDREGLGYFWGDFWGEKHPHACPSIVLRSMALHTLNRMGIKHPTHEKNKLTATIVFRRGSTRLVANEHKLVQAVRSKVETVNVIDLGALTWIDQVQLISQTDILIGVHGAALSQCVFLPFRSAMIEIRPFAGRGANATSSFGTLGTRAGAKYFDFHITNESHHITKSRQDGYGESKLVYINIDRFQSLLDRVVKGM